MGFPLGGMTNGQGEENIQTPWTGSDILLACLHWILEMKENRDR
jgi:hypothetical protein